MGAGSMRTLSSSETPSEIETSSETPSEMVISLVISPSVTSRVRDTVTKHARCTSPLLALQNRFTRQRLRVHATACPGAKRAKALPVCACARRTRRVLGPRIGL